jgi:glycosyltransferase involved in cell wall biosynthesis
VRILFVDHTGQLGGAEHSMITLLEGLPADVRPVLASPAGPLRDRVRAIGIEAVSLPGTTGSFRLHAVRTPRAVAQIVYSAAAVRSAARRVNADLVHANSVRAGLITVLARTMGAPPTVVHVRDVLPPGHIGTAIRRTILRGAIRTICISEYVARNFAPQPGPGVTVIYNGVDLQRFSPSATDRGRTRAALGIARDEPALGVIAQLTPWKGQDDAVSALAMVRAEHPRTRLFLVGEAKFVGSSVRHDNETYAATLHALAERVGVADAVTFLGERRDVPELLSALDIALVPSWEEPFGRSVIEAMAMERPVIATSVGGPAEIVEHGVTGLLASPRSPADWSESVIRLLADIPLRSALGTRARASLVGRFDQAAHVESTIAVYRAALAAGG